MKTPHTAQWLARCGIYGTFSQPLCSVEKFSGMKKGKSYIVDYAEVKKPKVMRLEYSVKRVSRRMERE